MRLASRIAGAESPPLEQALDTRWVMAYSAGIGETDARCYDTTREDLPVHPVFPVCWEWQPLQPVRTLPELEPVYPRLVHAQHAITLHRPLRAGETVRTSARIVAALARAPGAFVVFRCETRDARGAPVVTSDYGYLYRGVALEGPEARLAEVGDPPALSATLSPLGEIAVPATAAHVYTECARIFNPIHTDLAYARAAGLPGIILHGTATLALSVSRALRAYGADWRRVRGLSCRFSGMVLMPSTLSVHAAREAGGIAFETANERGERVISRGRLLLE
ncbi:MAG TPA: MaoC family dehydratase N-terminal domain-containing protein [Burkholderiales bacterium]